MTDEEWAFLRAAFFRDGLLAVAARCPFSCCALTYNEAEPFLEPRDARDRLLCPCHLDVFDPWSPVAYAEPSPTRARFA